MGDRDKRESGSSPIGARVRSALGAVREQGAASLRGVRRSAAGATDRLKSTQAAEKLGAVVEARRLLKKATDAQRRGNHPMAYRLLEPEARENPDDVRVVTAFWSAALACERAEEAVPALLRIIRKLASSGDPERAAELWLELREASPSALVDPSSLVRIAATMEAGGRAEEVTRALREAMDPRNDSGLSPGLAVRIAEMARPVDPPTALAAARRALTAPDLHDAKRARLEGLVAELEKDGARAPAARPAKVPAKKPAEAPAQKLSEAPAKRAPEAPAESPPAAPAERPPKASAKPPPAAPAEPPPAAPAERPPKASAKPPPAAPAEPPPAAPAAAPAAPAPAAAPEPPAEKSAADDLTERAVDEALEALAPAFRFSDVKVTQAMPTRFRDEAIALQLLGGRKAGIEYTKIEAVAAAEVGGLADHPVVVIDLVLNWKQSDDTTLRVARFRSDGFDPRMVIEAPDDPAEALRSFLSEILTRSGAVALPDPGGAPGANLPAFEDLASYQREVLLVASS